MIGCTQAASLLLTYFAYKQPKVVLRHQGRMPHMRALYSCHRLAAAHSAAYKLRRHWQALAPISWHCRTVTESQAGDSRSSAAAATQQHDACLATRMALKPAKD